MNDDTRSSVEPPPDPRPYEAPAIIWEEELPQGPNLFLACAKIGGTGGDCNSFPGS
jgi:hypothetical protein